MDYSRIVCRDSIQILSLARARSPNSIPPSCPFPNSKNAFHRPLFKSEVQWSSYIHSPSHDDADFFASTVRKPSDSILLYFWANLSIRKTSTGHLLPLLFTQNNAMTDHVFGDNRELCLYLPFLSAMQWSSLRSNVWFQDLMLYFFF